MEIIISRLIVPVSDILTRIGQHLSNEYLPAKPESVSLSYKMEVLGELVSSLYSVDLCAGHEWTLVTETRRNPEGFLCSSGGI